MFGKKIPYIGWNVLYSSMQCYSCNFLNGAFDYTPHTHDDTIGNHKSWKKKTKLVIFYHITCLSRLFAISGYYKRHANVLCPTIIYLIVHIAMYLYCNASLRLISDCHYDMNTIIWVSLSLWHTHTHTYILSETQT